MMVVIFFVCSFWSRWTGDGMDFFPFVLKNKKVARGCRSFQSKVHLPGYCFIHDLREVNVTLNLNPECDILGSFNSILA
jgi:hypothetical protein